MAGSDEDRTITGWRTDSKLYRRPPGIGWLLALLAVPLLLGLIGWSGMDRTARDNTLTLPSVSPSATLTEPSDAAPSATAPALSYAPFSITRNSGGFSLAGELPDVDTKNALLESLRTAFGPGANLTDNLNIKAGINTPDFASLGSILGASMSVPDFGFSLDGDTIKLTGTAASEKVKADIEGAAREAWPDLKVVNEIQVKAGQCATLQADITGLLRTPINFSTDGFTLTPASQQLLKQVADKLKACPAPKVSVVGHTDNTGNDGINIPLSGNRAKSVADYLVSQGVTGDRVTSRGAGAANPVASNGSPAGRAQNRRVEITVS